MNSHNIYNDIICIDVGASTIKHCMVNTNKYVIPAPSVLPTQKGADFERELHTIIEQYPKNTCISIGFCGIVKDKKELYSESIQVEHFNLNTLKLGQPIYAANDVFCNALTEWEALKDKKKSAIVVIIGTSIAMSYVHSGKVITGQNGIFGEIVDIDLELGNYYLQQHNLTDFTFLSNPTSKEYKEYYEKVFQLIKLISAIFAPDEIIFGGGVVFHNWNQSFRLQIDKSLDKIYYLYRPKIRYQQLEEYRNIKGISILPRYYQLHNYE